MICGFIGKMGCLAKGTLVKTIDGDKPIEECKNVLSYANDGSIVGMPCTVVPTKKPAWEILLKNHDSIICSGEHPFLTFNHWRKASEVRENNVLLGIDEGLIYERNAWEVHKPLSDLMGKKIPVVGNQQYLEEYIVKSTHYQGPELVEMYDLIVPNTNNFILSNGLITHNSGKTLSMTRELYKYYQNGHKIITNYGLSFPHERINFEELYMSAESQEEMNNLVIALDEVHIVLDSRSGMSSVNKIITFWLNQTRKMGVKLFYTTQYLHQIDKRLRSGTDIFVFTNGMKIIKNGQEYFVVQNDITDGDNSKKEIFIGNDYYKLYDTNEVVQFINKEEMAEKKKKGKTETASHQAAPTMPPIVEKPSPIAKQMEKETEWFT